MARIVFKQFLIVLTSWLLFISGAYADSYLAKPTGEYGIGFKDIHFQDNNRCPDIFYKVGLNESDYSPENANHCREIMIRAYYPTNMPVVVGDSSYASLIQHFKDLVTGTPNIESKDIQEFDKLQSYSLINIAPANPINHEKFPIVLFSHGGNWSVQDYENEITNLVSHGYVVVAINSFFVGNYITLPNEHIVHVDMTASQSDGFKAIQSDIMFTYDVLHKITDKVKITKNVDFDNIGIFGHSAGGRALANLIHSNNPKYIFKAASALDMGLGVEDIHDNAIVVDSFNIPFLHEISGAGFYAIHTAGASLKYILGNDNYLVGLAPNDAVLQTTTPPFYTTHIEFSDENTIKSMPVMEIYRDYTKTKGLDRYGTADSYYDVKSINIPLVEFFDTYLKNIPNPVFNGNICVPLSPNTIISCGPTVFPNQNIYK